MASRLTKSQLAAEFERIGFRANPLRGQCFLVDLNMMQAVVASAWLRPSDVVLEIGCGPGNLTAELAAHSGLVIAVEIEDMLFQLAQENLEFLANVRLVHADALESKYRLNPVIGAEIERALRDSGQGEFKVVSNLPYGIGTAVIMALLEGMGVPPSVPAPILMILSVQKEVADRLTAPSGVKDYGPLTVGAQSVAHVRRLRKMPPNVFWPRPQVESALIEIVPDAALRARIKDPDLMHRLTNALFEHRRKTLANSLEGSREFAQEWPKVLSALAACGIDLSLRGEALSVEDVITLANTLATA